MITGVKLDKTKKISDYKPSEAVKDRTLEILNDFGEANKLRGVSYEEFNDTTVIDRQNASQKAFNSYVPGRSSDPDEMWKAQTKRPLTRNKIISIAAHLTASVIKPQVFAQNERDEQDKDAEIVLRDLMDFADEQAEYDRVFVYAVISALYNPAVIIHTEFRNVMRTIKVAQADGTWKEEEIEDEAYSGFKDTVVPVDEIYIADFYEHDIQKQPFLVWRRVIDWTTAQTKYGNHENFKYVKPGLQTIFSPEDDTFYEQSDDELNNRQVEEAIYYNRSQDLEIAMLNGVMVSDVDQPNPRKDKRYSFAKSGYELVDEGKFFYYKSLADKLFDDQEVIDTLYNMIIDGTYLQLMPPQAIFGDEIVNSSINIPGVTSQFGKDTKIASLAPQSNIGTGLATLREVEGSAAESSQDVLQSGQSIKGSQTAFEIGRLEQNARTMLGLFGKMIGFLVKDLGTLRIGDIIQHLTVADVEKLTDGSSLMKFRNFTMPDRETDEGITSRKLEFTTDMPGTEEALETREFDLMEGEGNFDQEKEIWQINPTLFRNMKFKVKIEPDFKTPTSDIIQKALNLELYDRAIANPLADQEAVLRDVLFGSYDKTRQDPDRYINKNVPAQATPSGQAAPTDLIQGLAKGKQPTV